MDVSFSIDLHDENGGMFEKGIYLHIALNTIIKIQDIKELNQFIIKTEITENYDID